MVIFYKNSFLASLVAIFGSVFAIGGVTICIEGDMSGIFLILVGIVLVIWGKTISENKAFKKWWKQVVDAGLVSQIATSTQTAIAVYNKNPQDRTLKKIEELNPAAAQTIRQQIAQQNKK